MSGETPFASSRFEYEKQHLYFLSERLMEQLHMRKPVYLFGTRGSGKTTLLQALNWHERLHNKSLHDYLYSRDENPFGRRYVGVYCRLPQTQVQMLDSWLSNVTPELAGQIFTFYLDLTWLELVSDAIAELTVAEILSLSPDDEHQCIASIFSEHCTAHAFQEAITQRSPYTLKILTRIFRAVRHELEIKAQQEASIDPVFEEYPIGQFGAFGRAVGKKLSQLCNLGISAGDTKWHFKVCLDEGECLSSRQQLAINSLCRLSEEPVFLVIAYVDRPEDINKTFLNNLLLQDRDRQLIPLDTISRSEFRSLAEGVGTVRVQNHLNDPSAKLDIYKIFGHLNINRLLKSILENSVNKEAKNLLNRSEKMAKHPFFVDKSYSAQSDTIDDVLRNPDAPPTAVATGSDALADTLADSNISCQTGMPPIYETYLCDKLKLSLPDPNMPKWEKRSQDSEEFRKKMVAAYLSICNDLPGTEVRYASADMLLQMSDLCIADFLSQLQEVFLESKQDLQSFLTRELPLTVQYAGLKCASKRKRESLMKRVDVSPAQADRLVEGLGTLTALIQRSDPLNRHLSSTERGIFVLDITNVRNEGDASILDIITDVAHAGFIRIIKRSPVKWSFRMHNSLAAAFGFSYRGAYYETPIRIADLDKLRKASDDNETKSLVTKIADPKSHMPLFDKLD